MSKYHTITIRIISMITLAVFIATQSGLGYACDPPSGSKLRVKQIEEFTSPAGATGLKSALSQPIAAEGAASTVYVPKNSVGQIAAAMGKTVKDRADANEEARKIELAVDRLLEKNLVDPDADVNEEYDIAAEAGVNLGAVRRANVVAIFRVKKAIQKLEAKRKPRAVINNQSIAAKLRIKPSALSRLKGDNLEISNLIDAAMRNGTTVRIIDAIDILREMRPYVVINQSAIVRQTGLSESIVSIAINDSRKSRHKELWETFILSVRTKEDAAILNAVDLLLGSMEHDTSRFHEYEIADKAGLTPETVLDRMRKRPEVEAAVKRAIGEDWSVEEVVRLGGGMDVSSVAGRAAAAMAVGKPYVVSQATSSYTRGAAMDEAIAIAATPVDELLRLVIEDENRKAMVIADYDNYKSLVQFLIGMGFEEENVRYRLVESDIRQEDIDKLVKDESKSNDVVMCKVAGGDYALAGRNIPKEYFSSNLALNGIRDDVRQRIIVDVCV